MNTVWYPPPEVHPPREQNLEGPAAIPEYPAKGGFLIDPLDFAQLHREIFKPPSPKFSSDLYASRFREEMNYIEKILPPSYFGRFITEEISPRPEAKPVEKPDPYPSRAGWRADYAPPYDPSAEERSEKPKGKIGSYDIIESATTFDDIGGNQVAKDLLSEIAAQFEAPELYAKWDIPVPKGVLLHGKPGTGKTMLAKAFAHEAQAAFVEVPVATLRDKFYGESEKKLKDLFDAAARHKGPVVLFFDEIDSLLPNREASHGNGPDHQLVNTFLQAMDGMQSAPNVMVLGATNHPGKLDSAAARPGRFDRKVPIEFPDQQGCRDILARQLLKSERKAQRVLAEDQLDLDELGGYLNGLSGADIAEVLNRVKRTMAQTERGMGAPITVFEATEEVAFETADREALKITTADISAAIWQYLFNR